MMPLGGFSGIDELDQLNKEELRGYQWIANNGEVSTREYANNFDFGYKKAQRHLAKMKQLNLIEDNGLATTSPNYKYKLKDNLDN
jgi:predicted HTH transcriptional regulator